MRLLGLFAHISCLRDNDISWNTGESPQRDWDTTPWVFWKTLFIIHKESLLSRSLYCYEQLSQGTTNSHFMMIFDWCSVLANFAKKNLSEWDELPNMNISLNQLRHCVACNRFAESVNDASWSSHAVHSLPCSQPLCLRHAVYESHICLRS